ncbi:MAG: PIN domain-containing protein [Acidobacteria bacterium]|nr:PIN domain-containing protein [Acidobacteriota bacterium]
MILVVDSGAVYALFDADDLHHSAVRKVVDSHQGPLIIPVAILAEIDYLLLTNLGVQAELDFLKSLQEGAFTFEPFTVEDLGRCREIISQYRDLGLGLADTAVMATAERLRTLMVLTVDHRHFRAVVSQQGRPFRLLPADA